MFLSKIKIGKKKYPILNKYLNSKVKYLKNSISFLKNKNINFSILLSGNKEIKLLIKNLEKKIDYRCSFFSHFDNFNKFKKFKKKNIYLGDIILNYYKIEEKKF